MVKMAALDDALRGLGPGAELSLSLAEFPVDEILLTLHQTRFSGVACVGRLEEADHVFFRGGHVFDVAPPPVEDLRLMSSILLELRLISVEALAVLRAEHADADAAALGQRLLALGLVARQHL